MTTELDAEQVIKDVSTAVRAKYVDMDAAAIDAVVREEFQRLQDRPVKDYLSVLTERAAKQRLAKAARPAG